MPFFQRDVWDDKPLLPSVGSIKMSPSPYDPNSSGFPSPGFQFAIIFPTIKMCKKSWSNLIN